MERKIIHCSNESDSNVICHQNKGATYCLYFGPGAILLEVRIQTPTIELICMY